MQATVRLAQRNADIAYFVFTEWRRQGLALEAMRALLPELRAAYALTRIEAQIDTRNTASIRLVEALGFKLIEHMRGVDDFKGALCDEYRYALDTQANAQMPYDARRD